MNCRPNVLKEKNEKKMDDGTRYQLIVLGVILLILGGPFLIAVVQGMQEHAHRSRFTGITVTFSGCAYTRSPKYLNNSRNTDRPWEFAKAVSEHSIDLKDEQIKVLKYEAINTSDESIYLVEILSGQHAGRRVYVVESFRWTMHSLDKR